MKISPIRHTWSGDFAIGYQTVGEGSVDLVYVPPWASNLDWNWRWDHHARFLRRLGSFSRLILFDPRGWGVSDRFQPGAAPSLDELASDLISVLDTLNLGKVALFASNEGTYVGLFAAAAFPERVSHLVTFHGSPVFLRTDDLPWELTPEAAQSLIDQTRKMPSVEEWSRQFVRDALPSHADDEQALEWFATMLRVTEAPGSIISHIETMMAIDLRKDLSRIAASTLVLHRNDLQGSSWRIESSRYLAERDGAVHRHRELDRAGGDPGRPRVDRTPSAA
jgi:pimeloyl-ACP methyl ester carboxylesterase